MSFARGTSSFLFYFTILFSSHCRASRCHLLRFHDLFLRSIRQFAHTYLMLLCSQRHFDQMRHMSLPTRCYPFNPAIVNPANTSYSTSCSRTHIQPFAVSLSQPVQPSVPVYKVTLFSCFRSPSRTQQALLCSAETSQLYYVSTRNRSTYNLITAKLVTFERIISDPFSTYVRSHQLA